jgi:surface antigen
MGVYILMLKEDLDMKKQLLPVVGIALAMGLMTGCSSDSTGMSKQNVGVLTGGVLGGLVGSQFGQGNGAIAGAAIGAVGGALLGSAIGKNMDDTDRMRMNNTFESNRSNQPSQWRNPDSGNSYRVTPQRGYMGSGGQPCREYTSIATIGGKRQQVYGTACRQADGSWQTVSQ